MTTSRTMRLGLGLTLCLVGMLISWSFVPRLDPWGSHQVLADIRPEKGLAFIASITTSYASDREGVSEALLFEDDVPLTGHQPHADIRTEGRGRFSHWGSSIYLSSTDGSDPTSNGREYRLVFPGLANIPTNQGWLGVLITTLGIVVTPWSRRRPTPPRVHDRRRSRAIVATTMVIAMAGAAAFVDRAALNARAVNTVVEMGDQSAYLGYARSMNETNYSYVGDRNRMPAVPFLQSLALREGQSLQESFESAKAFHIALSLFLVGILGAIFITTTGLAMAAFLTATAGFGVFMLKACYTQADLTFYVLFFASFLSLIRLLRRPALAPAVVTGVLLGVTHLTKAAVLPILGIFCALACIEAFRRRRPPSRVHWRTLGSVACLLLGFFVVIWPYIETSKQVFGHYFYNVNSTFYMWYDSWEEVSAGTRAHGDRVGWPQMPASEIPGPSSYVRSHGIQGCLERVDEGLGEVKKAVTRSFGFHHVVVSLAVSALLLALAGARRSIHLVRCHPTIVAFAVMVTGAYLLLFAWYARIASGVRFSLALLLPILFMLAMILGRLGLPQWNLRFGSRTISAQTTLLVSLWGMLVAVLIPIFATHAASLYAGS